MIISIHIPKTAGTTFRYLLLDIYKNKLIEDYPEEFIQEYQDVSDTEYFLHKDIFTLHPFSKFNRKVWKYLFTQECIYGHFEFARYAQVPNSQFITWLREPVQRLI